MALRLCLSLEKELSPVSQMWRKMRAYEKDPNVKLVIFKGNGNAFCNGGDVASMIQVATAGHWSYPAIFYKKLLTLDYLIATCGKSIVCLFDGTVMGGGAGLSMHTPFRVATENTVFAMPEATIGLFPDVGASHFLSRLPGYFGEYLGLTGARLDGHEMLASGLATHLVPSQKLATLEDELTNRGLNALKIQEILNRYALKANLKECTAFSRLDVINKCFSKSTIEEIMQALENEATNSDDKIKTWVRKVIRYVKRGSPLSLKIFLKSIRQGRRERLAECLTRDYIIVCNMLSKRISRDFYEGSRAMLIDKDMKPKWEPSKLELVSKEMVDQYFVEMGDEDLESLILPYRSDPFVRTLTKIMSGQAAEALKPRL